MTTLDDHLLSLAPPRAADEDEDSFLARLGSLAAEKKVGWNRDLALENGLRLLQVATVLPTRPGKATGKAGAPKVRDWENAVAERLGVHRDELRRAVRALADLRETEGKGVTLDHAEVLRRPIRDVPRSVRAIAAGFGADDAPPKAAKEKDEDKEREKLLVAAMKAVKLLQEAGDIGRLGRLVELLTIERKPVKDAGDVALDEIVAEVERKRGAAL